MKNCSRSIAAAALLALSVANEARAADATDNSVVFGNLLGTSERSFVREHPVFDRIRRIVDRSSQRHQVFLADVDLDGDRTPERLVMIQDAELCGSAGCALFVFKMMAGQWRAIETLSAHRGVLTVQQESDEGWRRLHNGRHLLYRWSKCGYHIQEILDEYEKLGVDPCAAK